MKKMMIVLATSALVLAGASTANAATFSPASSTAGFTGTVTVKKDLELDCTMTVTVVTGAFDGNGDNTASVTAADLTDGLCGLVNFTNTPWSVTTNSTATTVTISGVGVNTLFSSCGTGSITGNWSNGAPATITFPSGTTLNPGGCTIVGVLTQTSGPALTIAP